MFVVLFFYACFKHIKNEDEQTAKTKKKRKTNAGGYSVSIKTSVVTPNFSLNMSEKEREEV